MCLRVHTLASGSGWNEPALKAVYHWGLNTEILNEMACRATERTLDSLTDLAFCLDMLLWPWLSSRSVSHFPEWNLADKPMHISQTQFSSMEKERWRNSLRGGHTQHSHLSRTYTTILQRRQRWVSRQHFTPLYCESDQYSLKIALLLRFRSKPQTKSISFQRWLIPEPYPAHTTPPSTWWYQRCGFYRCFIRRCSTIAGPLTNLLKKLWNHTADDAFNKIKGAFTTAFMMWETEKYWRHWMEGAVHPFTYGSQKN